MANIVLDGVTLVRSGVEILRDVSATIDDGEMLTVIGPSGSGKTSLLRTVAGLDVPTRGDVLFGGVIVTETPPARRDVAMVFQDNALIPFRSVRGNVSFPLEVHGVHRDEIDRRVGAESRAMTIERFLQRMPNQLAAGHQQLVQAARALVRRPAVFLLDEPLARVDPVLRQDMRSEIRLLQRGYGVTAMYATNDPIEAMALGDRILVIDRGRVVQLGTPHDIYHRPANAFVASFVGSPTMSMLPGRVAEREIVLASGALPMPKSLASADVTVGVRPEDWEIVPTAGLAATVVSIEHHGDHGFIHVDLAGDPAIVRTDGAYPSVGDTIELWTRRFHVFDQKGTRLVSVP
jgi:ABC-type sugar transport system ATPase subunit